MKDFLNCYTINISYKSFHTKLNVRITECNVRKWTNGHCIHDTFQIKCSETE